MILGFDKYSKINDTHLLSVIKNHCYCDNDVRAVWIGSGIPDTDNIEMKAWANWSTEHWAMYYGFLPYIGVPKNILDVGCGCGHSTVCLSNIFGNSDIVGIDISSNSINFAKEHNSNDNVKYLNSNFLDIKLDSKFNCIFSLEILEHIKADLHFGFIDKCLSLLSNDGLLCISTPNAIDEKDEPNGHIGLVNSDRALKLISRYRKNIVYSAFYDNKKLLSLNPDVYTVNGDIDNFNKDTDTKSHFKIIMKA